MKKAKLATLLYLLYIIGALILINFCAVLFANISSAFYSLVSGISILIFLLSLVFAVGSLASIKQINETIKKKYDRDFGIDSLDFLLEQISKEDSREYSAAIAKKQAEIRALQSQINPHFLYNTLDAIRSQALIDGSPVIADMTEALAMLFRYSISQKGSLVTLRDEMRNVDKYLMIQQFRFNNKFIVQKEFDDESLNNCFLPKLTLQPIVENAIYHGLETKKEGGIIRFQIYASQNRLVVTVSDNGKGMSESQLDALNASLTQNADPQTVSNTDNDHAGIALPNVNQRIQLLFGPEYGITVFSTMNLGTDVEILLPLITDLKNLPEGEVNIQ
ncbi:MAG: sensor histidine kinase [Acetivibrionales bacterium]|jgi:two-component system sensor histidine kinase YesM